MAPSKRLNLAAASDDDASSSASSSDSETPERQQRRAADSEEESQTEDESDEEFEIPPGFESVKGSGAVTREAVLGPDKELWFFKLPKNLDAAALGDVTFKIDTSKDEEAGTTVASVTVGDDHKAYTLQTEDSMLAGQLVNALPLSSDRARFVLAKPFSRCFSLVETHGAVVASHKRKEQPEAPVADAKKHKKKSKKEHGDKPRKHKK